MKLKSLFILLILSIISCSCFSQDDDEDSTTTTRLTPLTGIDYVRVLVDKKDIVQGAVYKVFIKSAVDRKMLWQGNVSLTPAINEGGEKMQFIVQYLKPTLWTPAHPFLYELDFAQFVKGKAQKTLTERVGFRSFEKRDNHLFLNGKPIFLRGIAINPPGRGIPTAIETSKAFALDYVKFMKSINVNIIRIPDAEAWYDVCDELGMMVFGGNYSGKVAGGEKVTDQAKVGDETDGGFPSDYDKGVAWYENIKLGRIAHHPSLMVYAMTNETPFAGKRAELWEKFLDHAFNKLKQWDPTRAYIANAGYGYGKTGDITDIHRYWGWYYSSPFTFLHIRDETKINPFASKHQPLTFTECVGNYTGPDGRYNLTPAHKNPSSQLAWTGHAQQDLQAQLADYHQSFTFRQATESFRQLREVNPDLSGVFPFTILFYNWNTINEFADMKPKPVTQQVKLSYQPVLLSWECWTPNIYAGTDINVTAHVINDDNEFKDVFNPKLVYELTDKTTAVVFRDSISFSTVNYFQAVSASIKINVPASLISGEYTLTGNLYSGGRKLSINYFKFFIAGNSYKKGVSTAAPIVLYDKVKATANALKKMNVSYSDLVSMDKLKVGDMLLIGENSADNFIESNTDLLKTFVANGGRVLCMRQDSTHRMNINALLNNAISNNNIDIDDPVYPLSVKPPRNGYYLNPERPDHPIFNGITREQLRVWSDYTNWNEKQRGFPAIKPVTDGFTLNDGESVQDLAIIANYGSGLQGIAIAEQFQEKGSIIINGLDLANRIGIDPVATRLMANLIDYAGNTYAHEAYVTITQPITWGEYQTEKGIVTDLYSGFLVNATPRVSSDYLGKGIVVSKEGYQLAGGAGSGFNTRPGIQYVANGRRPFGPFAQSFGGQPIPDKNFEKGKGSFWCRIPADQNSMTTVAWNPSKDPLVISIKVNEQKEISTAIPAGEKIAIESMVDKPVVHVTFESDRRLVILETSFKRK